MLQREVNILSSEPISGNSRRRKQSLWTLLSRLHQTGESGGDEDALSSYSYDVVSRIAGRVVLQAFDDASEVSREMAVRIMIELAEKSAAETLLRDSLPVLTKRLGCEDLDGVSHLPEVMRPTPEQKPLEIRPVEKCEEVRLLYQKFVSVLLERTPDETIWQMLTPVTNVLRALVMDPCPAIKLQACELLTSVCYHHSDMLVHFAPILGRSLASCIHHAQAKVRLASLECITAVLSCGLFKHNTEIIQNLIGWHDPNSIPVKAFYEHHHTVNYFARLVSDESSSVRWRFYKTLCSLYKRLPDKLDYESYIFPYIITGLFDADPHIQERMFEEMESCGVLYEQENEKDLRDQKQLGYNPAWTYEGAVCLPFPLGGSWRRCYDSALSTSTTAPHVDTNELDAACGFPETDTDSSSDRGQLRQTTEGKARGAADMTDAGEREEADVFASCVGTMRVSRGRGRLGTRCWVRVNFRRYAGCLFKDVEDFKHTTTLHSAKLLVVSIAFVEDSITEWLEPLLRLCCRKQSRGVSLEIQEAYDTALNMVGAYVAPSAYWGIVKCAVEDASPLELEHRVALLGAFNKLIQGSLIAIESVRNSAQRAVIGAGRLTPILADVCASLARCELLGYLPDSNITRVLWEVLGSLSSSSIVDYLEPNLCETLFCLALHLASSSSPYPWNSVSKDCKITNISQCSSGQNPDGPALGVMRRLLNSLTHRPPSQSRSHPYLSPSPSLPINVKPPASLIRAFLSFPGLHSPASLVSLFRLALFQSLPPDNIPNSRMVCADALQDCGEWLPDFVDALLPCLERAALLQGSSCETGERQFGAPQTGSHGGAEEMMSVAGEILGVVMLYVGEDLLSSMSSDETNHDTKRSSEFMPHLSVRLLDAIADNFLTMHTPYRIVLFCCRKLKQMVTAERWVLREQKNDLAGGVYSLGTAMMSSRVPLNLSRLMECRNLHSLFFKRQFDAYRLSTGLTLRSNVSEITAAATNTITETNRGTTATAVQSTNNSLVVKVAGLTAAEAVPHTAVAITDSTSDGRNDDTNHPSGEHTDGQSNSNCTDKQSHSDNDSNHSCNWKAADGQLLDKAWSQLLDQLPLTKRKLLRDEAATCADRIKTEASTLLCTIFYTSSTTASDNTAMYGKVTPSSQGLPWTVSASTFDSMLSSFLCAIAPASVLTQINNQQQRQKEIDALKKACDVRVPPCFLLPCGHSSLVFLMALTHALRVLLFGDAFRQPPVQQPTASQRVNHSPDTTNKQVSTSNNGTICGPANADVKDKGSSTNRHDSANTTRTAELEKETRCCYKFIQECRLSDLPTLRHVTQLHERAARELHRSTDWFYNNHAPPTVCPTTLDSLRDDKQLKGRPVAEVKMVGEDDEEEDNEGVWKRAEATRSQCGTWEGREEVGDADVVLIPVPIINTLSRWITTADFKALVEYSVEYLVELDCKLPETRSDVHTKKSSIASKHCGGRNLNDDRHQQQFGKKLLAWAEGLVAVQERMCSSAEDDDSTRSVVEQNLGYELWSLLLDLAACHPVLFSSVVEGWRRRGYIPRCEIGSQILRRLRVNE
eukprot:GHVQ01040734.1.p1 GENE.GHVQ01040734.1~~GHVQ01040734.1.p1  ORF type:complete len:1558 (-),score=234.71 GHVQ01040734.1:258-4931(-)